MKASNNLTRLWWLLCLLSNVYQLYQLCDSYFKYQVATEVRIAFENNISLANVAVCFDIIQLVNWTALSLHERAKFLPIAQALRLEPSYLHPNGLNDHQVAFITRRVKRLDDRVKILLGYSLMNEMKVSDVFSYTLTAGEIISGLFSVHNSSQLAVFTPMSKLRKLVKIRRYMTTYQICYALSFDVFSIQSILQARDFVFLGLVHCIMFTPNLASRVDIMKLYYLSEDRPRHGFTKTIRLTLGDGDRAFSTSHRQITRQLLEPPYETRCMRYTRVEDSEQVISSKGECHESCVFQQSLKLFDRVYPAITLSRRAGTVQIMAPLFGDLNKISLKAPFNISIVEKRCRQLCSRQDCDSKTYIPVLNSYLIAEPHLLTFLPSNPPIHIKAKPVATWSYFVSNVFSSLSFWLGLSLLDFARIATIIKCTRTGLSETSDTRPYRVSRVDRIRHIRQVNSDHRWDWYIIPSSYSKREHSFFEERFSDKNKMKITI